MNDLVINAITIWLILGLINLLYMYWGMWNVFKQRGFNSIDVFVSFIAVVAWPWPLISAIRFAYKNDSAKTD